jgi:hypothetical protein
MHVHDSALQGAIIFTFVILFGIAWRLIASHLHDKPIGKAMGFAY